MTNTINFAAADNAANVRPAYAFLVDNGIASAWAVYTASDHADQFEEATIRDIVFKLERYGSISPKQVAFLRSLLDRIAQRATRANARAAEAASAADVPTGRIEITGEVITTKYQDSRFGTTLKMLVRHATGYKVWGTVPGAISGVQKGDTVSFTAAVEPSPSDPKFGFFSRPTGARVITNLEVGR